MYVFNISMLVKMISHHISPVHIYVKLFIVPLLWGILHTIPLHICIYIVVRNYWAVLEYVTEIIVLLSTASKSGTLS